MGDRAVVIEPSNGECKKGKIAASGSDAMQVDLGSGPVPADRGWVQALWDRGDDDDVVYWYSFSNHYTKRAFTQP